MKRIILYLFIILTASTYNCYAQKFSISEAVTLKGPLKGKLTGNQVYWVVENISIEKGDSLIIEPGAIIEFSEETEFIVFGKLTAEGLPDHSITFKGHGNPESRWSGIQLMPGSEMSEIRYCIFEQFGKSNNNVISPALNIKTGELISIRNCKFINGTSYGIFFENFGTLMDVVISDCSFERISEYAVGFVSGNISGTLSLRYNTVIASNQNSSGGFLFLDCNFVENIFIDGNSFNGASSSSDGGLFSFKAKQIREVNINENIFSGNFESGGNGGIIHIESESLSIIKIIGNNGNFVSHSKGNGGFANIKLSKFLSELLVFGNTITSSSSENGNGGFLYLDVPLTGKFSFSSNTINGFSKSAAGCGGLIYCTTGFPKTGSIQLSDNTFNDLFAGSKAGLAYFSGSLASQIDVINNTINGSSISEQSAGAFLFSNHGNINSVSLNIERNVINGKLQTNGDGGLIYWAGNGLKELIIHKNNIKESRSNGDGGVVFIYTNDTINTIEFSSNEIDVSSSNNFGGVLSMISGHVKDVKIDNNTVGHSTSGKSGSFLSFKSELMNHIQISNNDLEKSTSQTDGGAFYLRGNLNGDITLFGNTFTESISNESGGVIKIDNKSIINNTSLVIRDNSFLYTSAVKGNGGVLQYTGLDLKSTLVSNNNFSNSTSIKGNGGAFDFELKNKIWQIDFSKNTVSFSGCYNEGGFSNFNTPEIEILRITENDFLNENPNSNNANNGGIISIKQDAILDSLVIKGNRVSNIRTANNGGSFYLNNLKKLNLISQNNSFQNNLANGSGGVYYLTGRLNSIIVEGDTASNCTVLDSGGAMFFSAIDYPESKVTIENSVFTTPEHLSGNESTCQFGQGVFIKGFNEVKIKKVLFKYSSAKMGGGALYLENNQSNRLVSLIFKGCRTHDSGASILAQNFRQIDIDSCNFTNNFSKKGAVSLFASTDDHSEIFIKNSAFRSNRADSVGGGIYIKGGKALIENSDLSNCLAGRLGGAIFSDGTQISLLNSNLYENVAEMGGAAYFKEGDNPSANFTIKNSYLNNNRATDSGGGLCSDHSSGSIIRTHIGNNMVDKYGAGALLIGDRPISVLNSLIYSNTSLVSLGSGFYLANLNANTENEATVLDIANSTFYVNQWMDIRSEFTGSTNPSIVITNSILYGSNQSDGGLSMNLYDSRFNILNSCIQGLPDSLSNNTNFDQLPGFSGSDDLTLNKESICIDAGHTGLEWFDSLYPPAHKKRRNDVGATGGRFNHGNTEFYKTRILSRLKSDFHILSANCSGETILKILNFEEDFTYSVYVNDTYVKEFTSEIDTVQLKPLSTNTIRVIARAVTGMEHETIQKLFVSGYLNKFTPKIINSQGIVDGSVYDYPCEQSDCSFDLLFEIFPPIFPQQVQGSWIITDTVNSQVTYMDSKYLRLRVSINPDSEIDHLDVGYITTNPCSSKEDWFTINFIPPPISSSPMLNSTSPEMEAWPNPFDNILNIKLDGESQEVAICEIRSIQGAKLLSKEIRFGGQIMPELDLGILPAGIYILSIKGSKFYLSKKIIKH